jgi:cytoplasmic iron level regulating protein YaaA (DUF328/UPF0246 family)
MSLCPLEKAKGKVLGKLGVLGFTSTSAGVYSGKFGSSFSLFGLLRVDTPIPYAEYSWEDHCQGSRLKDWWKEPLKQISKELLKDQVVVPLVGRREEGLLDLGTAHKVVRFFFYKKGQKVINPQPHRAYLLRYIAEKRLNLEEFSKINFYDYRVKDIEEKGKLIRVIVEGQGAYI